MLRKVLMGILVVLAIFSFFTTPVIAKNTENMDRLIRFKTTGEIGHRVGHYVTLRSLRNMERRVKVTAEKLGLEMNCKNIDDMFKSGKLTPANYIVGLLKTDTKFTALLAEKQIKDTNSISSTESLWTVFLFTFTLGLLFALILFILAGLNEKIAKFSEEKKDEKTEAHIAKKSKRVKNTIRKGKFLIRLIKLCRRPATRYLKKLDRLLVKNQFLNQWIEKDFKNVSRQKPKIKPKQPPLEELKERQQGILKFFRDQLEIQPIDSKLRLERTEKKGSEFKPDESEHKPLSSEEIAKKWEKFVDSQTPHIHTPIPRKPKSQTNGIIPTRFHPGP